MPALLALISAVGVAAMIWVGGHIILAGLDELGWHAPYALVHHVEEAARDATGAVGGMLAWLVDTAASALLGLLWGAVLVGLLHLARRLAPGRAGAGH
ncbi:MAG: DUF808 family protein [Nocardioides sp.]